MESEEHPSYNSRQAEDDAKEEDKPGWMASSMVSLLAVGLGLLCSLIVFAFVLTAQSSRNETTTVYTWSSHHFPKVASPRITPRSNRTPHLLTNTSGNARAHPVNLLKGGLPIRSECQTTYCHKVSDWLRTKLDYSVDPCKDFYKFVCNSFRGQDAFIHIKEQLRMTTLAGLQNTVVPPYKQLAWEKAAAMYQACVSFASMYQPETGALVRWMISMNLDLYNTTMLSKVDSVEMMVRGSLQLGLYIILYIAFEKRSFTGFKRDMEIGFSKEQDTWLQQRDEKGFQRNLGDYSLLFLMYGCTTFTKVVRSKPESARFMLIKQLGNKTDPYVYTDNWVHYFSKYTNGIYGANDLIRHQAHTTGILLDLFKSEHVGIRGLRYLVAWSVFRQLAEFTEPYLFRGERSASDACYTHVETPMHLAIISKYFNDVGAVALTNRTERMVSHISDIFKEVLANSSWVGEGPFRGAADKLDDIVVNVGSPGQRLDPSFIEHHFEPLGDVPVKGLFPSWIKASSIAAHYVWSDQETPLYDESEVTARYFNDYNIVTVPTALIHPPLMFLDGPLAMNYGGTWNGE
ncbi:hypothetical protein MTO96_029122 [Rhipicephalus appendiculatus]